ncbi:hypothetical protein [Bacillus toyonensis]|uniref:hypothetical protein n=1 Tax=Bacillus toyonensis TaxID=155322 RepID=UPI00159BA478|nr:hypothetical protein [Bacillus toyonensis]
MSLKLKIAITILVILSIISGMGYLQNGYINNMYILLTLMGVSMFLVIDKEEI